MADAAPINVCMVGTGEYTTGYVHGEASASDKSKGGARTFGLLGRGPGAPSRAHARARQWLPSQCLT